MHIPVENRSHYFPCGNNVFLIGHKHSKERIMIDAGELLPKGDSFLTNFKEYLIAAGDVYISTIFITHAHYDHMGALNAVL